ncbi:MAG: thiamine pyrophosphate-dependent enzyme, partial [Desulfobaccales bacterium]
VLYESINFAILKKLPVLFVLENNQYSVCSHVSARQVGEIAFHALPPDLLFTRKVDGNDVLAVYEAAGEAVSRARAGLGPAFLECLTYRILGHAGCEAQDSAGYRSPEEVARWKRRCPLARLQEELLAAGIITKEDAEALERRIDAELDEAFAGAQRDPHLPQAEELPLYLFCEQE